MTELMREKRREERPDPAGIVRRGAAAEDVRRFTETAGKPPPCAVGKHYEGPDRMTPRRCERTATMEVYGLWMCEAHGEEAAGGALEEIAYDLEQELQRSRGNPFYMNPSPHVEDGHGLGIHDPPYDRFVSARLIVCRHMRLAFEEGVDWLVEILEEERESVAAQAAYALALEREADLR